MIRTGLSKSDDEPQAFKAIKDRFFSFFGSLKYWMVVYGVAVIILLLITHVLVEQSIIPDVFSIISSKIGL